MTGTYNKEGKDVVNLRFSDGRKAVCGVECVNNVLLTVGVRISILSIPDEAKLLLKDAQNRAITEKEQKQLISLFELDRNELLEQIRLAGRHPVVEGGGVSSTEVGLPPYPKVYDMKAMTQEVQSAVLNKYGRLHVNSSDSGIGIDEVMTVVSGGPFTWCFVLSNGVVTRLTVNKVGLDDSAVRLSYPGLGMHAGVMDPKQGLIVAFTHGPESFITRFEEPNILHDELLNTNPWMDFSDTVPKLRNEKY